MNPAILVEGLRKSFGDIHAVAGVDLQVPAGTVLGLLGPNGAGKTTVVRMLATLLAPDSGRAEILGLDVVRDAEILRARLGLTGQYAAVDGQLTGRENLVLVGKLYHLGRVAARRRADELLEQFELTDAATRPAKTYSGGMRRRLDLAASLVNAPEVLFLDEPTTGLDPRSRLALWAVIEDLVAQGTTLLLTTQYLDEADRLADRIAVIDTGTVIAEGTADELKDRVGGAFVDLRVADLLQVDAAVAALAALGSGEPTADHDTGRIAMPSTDGSSALVEAVRALDGGGIDIGDLSLRRPTLDDVFLALTGHAAGDGADDDTRSAA